MKLTIHENIRRLRRERGMTQERLAELLGVSNQAVSKWESKSSYPDITALIPLSEILGVSVDELLGNQIGERAERLAEVKMTLKRIQYDDRRSDEDYLEYARAAVAEFPADEELQHGLAWALKYRVYAGKDLDDASKEKMSEEAEKILLRLIDTVTDEQLHCAAVYTLVELYADCMHDTKRAMQTADRLPEMEWCRELVRADAFSGGGEENSDLAARFQQEAILVLTDNLCRKIAALSQYRSAQDCIFLRRTANEFYTRIYGETIPWETLAVDVSANYLAIARAQAEQGNAPQSLDSLNEMCDAMEKAAGAFPGDSRTYASIFLDRLTPVHAQDAECRKLIFIDQVSYRLKGLGNKAFDGLRGEERFAAVAGRLTALEKRMEQAE